MDTMIQMIQMNYMNFAISMYLIYILC